MSRREIREKVLQALYACSLTGESEDVTFAQLLQKDFQKLEKLAPGTPESEGKFLHQLYFGTLQRTPAFVEMVTPRLENWDYERVAMVDRVLLNMALYELLHCAEIPTRVTLNEYLELAKRYSTEKSNQFLNGVLDPLLQQLKQEGRIQKTGKGLIEPLTTAAVTAQLPAAAEPPQMTKAAKTTGRPRKAQPTQEPLQG